MNFILLFDQIFQTSRKPRIFDVIFPFNSDHRKCLLYTSANYLWNASKVCWVSVALLISSHLMLLMAWQKFSLLRELYNLLYTYASFSLIFICLTIWNTGKWSDISVMSWSLHITNMMNILSINVADMAATLDWRVVSGKKTLLDIISRNWAVCAWLA